MKSIIQIFSIVIAFWFLLFASLANASPKSEGFDTWSAVSTASIAITGDIALRTDQLMIGDDEHIYQLTKIRNLDPTETGIASKMLGFQSLKKGALYKIYIPASTKFRPGNRICGKYDVNKIIIVDGGTGLINEKILGLIFIGGKREPFNLEKESMSGGICAALGYQNFNTAH